jgi:hypothetical protein
MRLPDYGWSGQIHNGMKTVQDEHYFYTLLHDESTDEYFLDALCGTVAQYSIVISLSPDEIAEYHRDPLSIRHMAQSIVDAPTTFLDRRVDIGNR